MVKRDAEQLRIYHKCNLNTPELVEIKQVLHDPEAKDFELSPEIKHDKTS